MRRSVVLLVSAIAFVALGAASASASGPVWAYCGKAVPKNTGTYTDKACSVESPTHEGKYEVLDGIGRGKPFKGRIREGEGGQLELWGMFAPGEVNVECQERSIKGHMAAPNKVTGVVISGNLCRTSLTGESMSCVLHIGPLTGELGWIDREKEEAGLELTSEANPEAGVVTETSGCLPGAKLRWRGSAIGSWGPLGQITREETLTFTTHTYEEGGRQFQINPPAFEGEVGFHVLRDESNSVESHGEWAPPGGYPAGLEGDLRIEKSEALMVR